MTRRILSIWLPDLAIERWLRSRRGSRPVLQGQDKQVPPAVLTESGARGVLIVAVTAPARRLGIAPGMRLTDARAICPALGATPHDSKADAALLEMMADAMLRFTPWVALDVSVQASDSLMLDVTGCAHLAGGEAALVAAIHTIFKRAGFTARMGLASTQGAAWALARHGLPGQILTGDAQSALASMPVAALRLMPETVDMLTTLGLKRIDDLISLDRASLMRRFPPGREDPGPLVRLDQALGRRDEPLTPRMEAPDYRVRVSPLEPLIDLEGVRHHFHDLLGSLLGILSTDGRGARRLTLHAFRCDGPVVRTEIALARASREEEHIKRLFEEKLGKIDPGFGIDTLMLSADATEPVTARQCDLQQHQEVATPDALERLVDRIANHLGPDSIHRFAPVESHNPSRAVRRKAALPMPREFDSNLMEKTDIQPAALKEPLTIRAGRMKGGWEGTVLASKKYSSKMKNKEKTPRTNPQNCAGLPVRPLTLLERPEAIAVMAEIPEGPPVTFRWRRVLHRVTRATGPERIAPEWWRDLADQSRSRDYYIIEDANGGRYWLFRDGLYHEAHIRGAPDWFLHGVFS